MLKGIFSSLCGVTLVSLTLMLVVGCSPAPLSFQHIEGSMLGTRYHITAELPSGSERKVMERAETLDKRMKREMSIFDESSLLNRINRSECDKLTPWLEANIRLADSVSRLSGGIYDITVAPLVKALGFAGGEAQSEVAYNRDSLMEFVGYEGISIRDGRLIKRDPRIQIDLNSIAKGFAVDRLADIIHEMGAENYIVEIGGEVVTRGTNPSSGAWRIGIESPVDGNMSDGELLQQRVAISPESPLRAMATSGNYRRFFINERGEKFVHTVNPKTGRAESSALLSVSVMAKTCAEADAMATMLLAAGATRAETLAESLEGCEVYLIYNSDNEDTEYRIYCSKGMQQMLLN